MSPPTKSPGALVIPAVLEAFNVHVAGGVNGVASIVDGSTFTLWDLETGEVKHAFAVSSIGLSVATRAHRCVVDGEAGMCVRSLSGEQIATLGDGEDVPFETPYLSPDGEFVVGVNGDERLVWNATTGQVVHRWEGLLYRGAFTPEGQFVAVIERGEALALIDPEKGTVRMVPKFRTDPTMSEIVVSPSGTRALIGSRRGVTAVDVADGKVAGTIKTTKNVLGCALLDEDTALLALGNGIGVASLSRAKIVATVAAAADNVLITPDRSRVVAVGPKHLSAFPANAFI